MKYCSFCGILLIQALNLPLLFKNIISGQIFSWYKSMSNSKDLQKELCITYGLFLNLIEGFNST